MFNASQTKPWKNSTNSQRLDKYNDFLLMPNLDKLFNKGYISFDDEGKIMMSNELNDFKQLSANKNIQMKHNKYLYANIRPSGILLYFAQTYLHDKYN